MTDYSKIPARELDALVAREVMGWREAPDGFGGTLMVDAHGNPTGFFTPSSFGSRGNDFRPSTDGSAMLTVLDALREMEWTVYCHTLGGFWWCMLTNEGDYYEAYANALPRAVSEAALAAVGGK